jgi:hypothetical protein
MEKKGNLINKMQHKKLGIMAQLVVSMAIIVHN